MKKNQPKRRTSVSEHAHVFEDEDADSTMSPEQLAARQRQRVLETALSTPNIKTISANTKKNSVLDLILDSENRANQSDDSECSFRSPRSDSCSTSSSSTSRRRHARSHKKRRSRSKDFLPTSPQVHLGVVHDDSDDQSQNKHSKNNSTKFNDSTSKVCQNTVTECLQLSDKLLKLHAQQISVPVTPEIRPKRYIAHKPKSPLKTRSPHRMLHKVPMRKLEDMPLKSEQERRLETIIRT